MTLIFRLIYNDNNLIELQDTYEGIINIQLIHELLLCWQFSYDEINNIQFIVDNEQLLNKNYIINKDENKIIYILTNDANIKNKFEILFNEYNKKEIKSDDIIKVKNEDNHENIYEITDTHIENINNETLKLFDDSDFKKLLNIYINKPDLYNILYQYIQDADLVKSNNNLNIENEKIQYYNILAEKINFLGFPKQIVINKLVKYNGHLNLTVRSLLQNINK
jgi:hypothetical protein|uniref:Uncharacterized protein n=1 Tax=viral metagenome TaxID=1070528 RepID=A0A6C0ECX9_9ZZZZ